ncbi:MAG: molecular chaperone HtpG, partial [Lysobacterales bacterium]
MTETVETRRFEAEVQQVLHLVVHSLYSHKEIFLRELISNASDACDKLRFESIGNPDLAKDGSDLSIDIAFDRDAGTLSITDNGIGMSRDEVIDHLGTIARSGTKRFLEALSGDSRRDTQLIGQFGVGFYSAFIVADRVTVETRRADAPVSDSVRWESNGSDSYQIETIERAARGTTVTLHLKDDEREFLDGWRLRELIHKYSEHIAFPIRMPVEKNGKPGAELEVVNQAKALWTRPRSEVTDDEYKAFYKQVSGDYREPLT